MNAGSSDLKKVGIVWNERVNSNLVGSEWYIANEVIETGFIPCVAMPADPNGMTKPALYIPRICTYEYERLSSHENMGLNHHPWFGTDPAHPPGIYLFCPSIDTTAIPGTAICQVMVVEAHNTSRAEIEGKRIHG